MRHLSTLSLCHVDLVFIVHIERCRDVATLCQDCSNLRKSVRTRQVCPLPKCLFFIQHNHTWLGPSPLYVWYWQHWCVLSSLTHCQVCQSHHTPCLWWLDCTDPPIPRSPMSSTSLIVSTSASPHSTMTTSMHLHHQ